MESPSPGTLERHGRVSHYRILRKLGEGGMGVVYAAHDERLDRSVAIKMIRGRGDDTARLRLWREARSAASVNHPNVCQLYDIEEDAGELFITMELLEGESLAERLSRGSFAVAEAVRIGRAILQPLEMLHGRGLVHRDLKPSNVFLTPHGVKLLDFGLARPIAADDPENRLTATGLLVGTPRYLAPEQLMGQEAGPRSDLFAVGVLIYEMLSGGPAFNGRTVMEVCDAILRREPPALLGSPGIARVDSVLRRALSKDPQRRYATANAMEQELSAIPFLDEQESVTGVRSLRRLIVLPFRMLTPDPDIAFLSISLPDAITGSLSNLESLTVRPSHMAIRFADQLHLAEIAAQADVDVILTGTLVRVGDQIRVSTQLVEARDEALVWSDSFQAPIGDVFQLQDGLTRSVVDALATSLTSQDRQGVRQDAPSDPRAYELYLRANHMVFQPGHQKQARELYEQCLELDPKFAPAWARLGRIHRINALYGGKRSEDYYEKAQQAFRRALELNPELSLAHNLYTYVEVDLGQSRDALIRLLRRAVRRPSDPELLAGLTHTCRHCGLLDAAIAAHELAVRVDPVIRTSVSHAYWARGNYERALETNLEDPPTMNALSLDLMGRQEEALALLRPLERAPFPEMYRAFIVMHRAAIEGSLDEAREIIARSYDDLSSYGDPCGLYYMARAMSRARDLPRALKTLRRSIERGFACVDLFERDPWLEPVRGLEEVRELFRYATDFREAARQAFYESGGDRLLGVASP